MAADARPRLAVDAVGREDVAGLDALCRVRVGEQRRHAHAVLVVGDAAAVVGLSRAVAQRSEGDVVVRLEEEPQLAHGDAQVGRVELVRNVPAERAELASLLDNGVEEGQAEE